MPKTFRNWVRDARTFGGRMFSRKPRRLPNFIIVGAPRSGTTSLFRYLEQHPDVEPPLKKEIHYFDDHYDRGPDWYRRFFPVESPDKPAVTGEATPSYMYGPDIPQRVCSLVPDVRIIMILRNPVDRAYSSYHKMVSIGVETDSFEDALDREGDVMARGELPAHPALSYIWRSLYYRHVSSWMDLIEPSHLLILQSETFYQNSEVEFKKVVDFLGLSPWRPAKFKVYNDRRYSELATSTRRELEEFFSGPNRKLEELTGLKFSWS